MEMLHIISLGPNVITDETFIALGFEMLSLMGPFLHLVQMLLQMGRLALGSSYDTCALYNGLLPEPVLSNY